MNDDTRHDFQDRNAAGSPPVSETVAGAILTITVAGTIGNLADSVLGATLERAGVLSNDGVNFFNTLTAALVAGCLAV